MGKGAHSLTTYAMQNPDTTIDSHREIFAKSKSDLLYDLVLPVLDMYTKNSSYCRDNCISIFVAAVFTMPKKWKQCKRASTDVWIKKMWYIYRMEFYSALRKDGIMKYAGIWIEAESVILSEATQSQKSSDVCALSFVDCITTPLYVSKYPDVAPRARKKWSRKTDSGKERT